MSETRKALQELVDAKDAWIEASHNDDSADRGRATRAKQRHDAAWKNARSALAQEAPASQELLEWAVSCWYAEVSQRPMVNQNRRPLDDTWRQVIRRCGGDPDKLLGPSHDALRAEITTNEWTALKAAQPVNVAAQEALSPNVTGPLDYTGSNAPAEPAKAPPAAATPMPLEPVARTVLDEIGPPAWICSPYGQIKANPRWKFEWPTTVVNLGEMGRIPLIIDPAWTRDHSPISAQPPSVDAAEHLKQIIFQEIGEWSVSGELAPSKKLCEAISKAIDAAMGETHEQG